MKTLGVSRWTDAETAKVIQRAMYVRLSKGCGMADAILIAQEELKITNRKTASAARQLWKSPQFKRVAEILKREMPEQFTPMFESFGSIGNPAAMPIKRNAAGSIDREPLKVRRNAKNMQRIEWTTGEKAKTAAELTRLLSDDISRRFRNRPWRFVDYVSEAQAVLPEARRKTFPALQALDAKGDLRKIIDFGIANQWILKSEEPAPAVQVQPPPVEVSAPQAAPMPVLDPLAAALSASIQAHVRNVVEGQILPGLVETFCGVVREEIRSALGALSGGLGAEVRRLIEAELGPVSTPPPAPPETPGPVLEVVAPAAPRPVLPSLDIVGLLPGQAEIVRKSINGRANLRFIDADTARGTQMRANVIAVRKFIGHDTEQKARASGSKFVRVNGGPQSVIKAVENFLQSNG